MACTRTITAMIVRIFECFSGGDERLMACMPAAELTGDVRGGARDLGLELVQVPVEPGAAVLLGHQDDGLAGLDGVVDLGDAERPEEHALRQREQQVVLREATPLWKLKCSAEHSILN